MIDGPALTIVTGAAGSLGEAIIDRLLRDSTDAVCLAIDADEQSLARVAESRERVIPHVLDLSNADAIVSALPELIQEANVPLVGLVNSAGINIVRDSLDLTPEEWRAVIGVNLEATFFMCQQAARAMAAGGAIVNLASVTMHFGTPKRVAYAATKAAIGSVTRTLAVEWADRGIRVNAVAPGYIDSRMVERASKAGAFDRDQVAAMHAMGRLGRPEEIAAAVAFLLSQEASFITGEVLNVEGGLLSKKT